jgi:probable phosphoglycerate mutase
MTLTLTLVRHGQTLYNARKLLQGVTDSDLTPAGWDGVRVTARHLAPSAFTAAYSSPAGRAVTTAVELLRPHPANLRLRIDPDLGEYSFGIFERRPESALEEVEPWAQFIPAVLAGVHPGLPGGERGADFMGRVSAAFARIIAAHPDGEVLVVGHGLTLAAYVWMVDSASAAPLPNASVTTVRIHHGRAEVVEVGLDIAGAGTDPARPITPADPELASAGVPRLRLP